MSSLDQNHQGISAILMAEDAAVSAVLDLAAVLQGLVSSEFEILIVGEPTPTVSDALAGLRVTAPSLPLRCIKGRSIADGCDAAVHDLVFVAVWGRRFDVRELNHLLDAIESGADVAVGYRPRITDWIVRQLQRLGWQVDVDSAFGLFRRALSCDLRRYASADALLWRLRHLGVNAVEVPLSNRQPTIGTPAPAEVRAA